MDESSTIIFRLIVMGLYAILPVAFLVRGVRRGPRSRRCANISLGLGLMAFVMPEITLKLADWERSAVFICSGGVRVVLGLLAVVLAIVALCTRRDGGTGVARPVVGLLFGLLHLAFGVGLFRVGTAVQIVTTSDTEWHYRSPTDGFRVTIPSSEWKEVPPIGGEGVTSFFCQLPRMYSSVLTPMRDQTEADFERVAGVFRERMEANPDLSGAPRFSKDANVAGHPVHYGMAWENGPEGRRLFIMYSVTWIPEKRLIVRLIFEAQSVMSSQAGREAEKEGIYDNAVRILLSVKEGDSSK